MCRVEEPCSCLMTKKMNLDPSFWQLDSQFRDFSENIKLKLTVCVIGLCRSISMNIGDCGPATAVMCFLPGRWQRNIEVKLLIRQEEQICSETHEQWRIKQGIKHRNVAWPVTDAVSGAVSVNIPPWARQSIPPLVLLIDPDQTCSGTFSSGVKLQRH